jgi:hypothetical protein
MKFLDTLKTKLFGDQNNRQVHGFRAGFVPTFVPSLVAIGAFTMGAPAALVVVVVGAVGAVGAGAGATAVVAGVVAVAVGAAAVAAGAVGAAAAVAGVCLAFIAAQEAEEAGYNFRRYLAGNGAGCIAGATLVFNVASGHLPQEQPNAPVAEPVPSTLHIEPRGGELCRGFNAERTTNAQGQEVYILTVPKGCTVPAAAAAPR